jgi:hypothetical protein
MAVHVQVNTDIQAPSEENNNFALRSPTLNLKGKRTLNKQQQQQQQVQVRLIKPKPNPTKPRRP